MNQRADPQFVVNRLTERLLKDKSPAQCMLGRGPLRRRGRSCSECTAPREFDLDRAIGQLIDVGMFKRAPACPYRVITSHLAAGLILGPEAFRAKTSGRDRVNPSIEINKALKHIAAVIRASGLSRDDIGALSVKGSRWKGLWRLVSAELALKDALESFAQLQVPEIRRSPRGKRGSLQIQAVTRALASAWRILTGRFPAKDNVRFHDLLSAAVASLFGHSIRVPNWEAATRTALQRMKRDATDRT